VFCRYIPSILYCFDVISAFVIAENGVKTISAAMAACQTGNEVTVLFLDPDLIQVGFGFFGYLLPVKNCSTFLICMSSAL
jgi:hypothetical protein